MGDDLDDLTVVETSLPHGINRRFGDVSAIFHDRDSELYRRIGLGVVRGPVTVGRDLGIVELGDVSGEVGVGGKAIATPIGLGDRERDPLSGLCLKSPLRKGAVQSEIAFESSRAVGKHPKQVRNATELLLGALEQWLGCCRSSFDGRQSSECGS